MCQLRKEGQFCEDLATRNGKIVPPHEAGKDSGAERSARPWAPAPAITHQHGDGSDDELSLGFQIPKPKLPLLAPPLLSCKPIPAR